MGVCITCLCLACVSDWCMSSKVMINRAARAVVLLGHFSMSVLSAMCLLGVGGSVGEVPEV